MGVLLCVLPSTVAFLDATTPPKIEGRGLLYVFQLGIGSPCTFGGLPRGPGWGKGDGGYAVLRAVLW